MLKQAILAAEDERFYQHAGIDYLGVVRAAYANLVTGGRTPGREHDHHAGGAQLLPVLGEDAHAQALRGAARLQDRAQPDQGPDPRALHQPDLPRPARLRLRGGLADLLRQVAGPADARRGGDARRAAQGAVQPTTRRQSAARQAAPAVRAAPHEGTGLHHRGSSSPRRVKAPLHVRREVDDFAVHAEYVAEMVRQAIYEQYPDDAYTRASASTRRSGRPTRRRRTQAVRARRARVRPQPRLPRSGRLRRAAGRTPDEDDFEEALAEHADDDDLHRGAGADARARKRGQGGAARAARRVTVTGDGLRFAARARWKTSAAPQRRIRRGAVIRVQQDDRKNWQIVQLPEVEAAFVSLDPARRRDPRAGRRLRLQPQQVQPRHPGLAPAGLRRSSRSSTRRRWRRASRRRR